MTKRSLNSAGSFSPFIEVTYAGNSQKGKWQAALEGRGEGYGQGGWLFDQQG